MLIWADTFSRYGTGATGVSNAMAGLYANVEPGGLPGGNAFPYDPDPLAIVRPVLCPGATVSNSNTTDTRWAVPKTTKNLGVAMRVWLTQLPPDDGHRPSIIAFRSIMNAKLVDIIIEPTGHLSIYDTKAGGPAVATSAAPVTNPSSWNHFEAFYDSSAGTIAVRVNGVERASYTWGVPQDANIGLVGMTCRQNNATASTHLYIKDFVVWDNTGTKNNSFFGTVLVEPLIPNADVTLGSWSVTGATYGYDTLDNNPPDDAKYISALASGVNQAEFALTDLPEDVTSVRGVVLVARARKSDAGDGTIKTGIARSTSETKSGDIPLTTASTYYPEVFENDPVTGGNILPAYMNDMRVIIDRVV